MALALIAAQTRSVQSLEKRAESKERALGANATQCSHADFPRADRKIAPEYRSLSQIPPTFAGVVPFNLHSASQNCTRQPTLDTLEEELGQAKISNPPTAFWQKLTLPDKIKCLPLNFNQEA